MGGREVHFVSSSTIPAEVLQLITCRAGKRFEAHPSTDGLATYIDLRRAEDSIMGAMLMWRAGNCNKAAVKMGEYEDKQRGVMRRVDTNSKYDIVRGTASPSALKEAKTILFVNANADNLSSNSSTSASNTFADMDFGAASGVTTLLLHSRERGKETVVSGALFFADEASADAFLLSDEWAAAKADSSWKDIVIARYEVVTDGTAPSA